MRAFKLITERNFVTSYTKLLVIVIGFYIVILGTSAMAVTRGYLSDDPAIAIGMAVVLAQDSENPKVERATPENLDRFVGIVVQPTDNLVTVGSSKSEIFVETSDEAVGYVTDLGGSVNAGDPLTVSPLKGLLMKANAEDVQVAVALEGFSDSAIETTVTTDDNSQKTVKYLRLNVSLINSGNNQSGGEEKPSSLQHLGNRIVSKDVTELQVIVALVVFIIMIVGEGAVIYAAISSGIISLGRNPMAKDLIGKQIFKTVGVALFVLAIGLAAIYSILWV